MRSCPTRRFANLGGFRMEQTAAISRSFMKILAVRGIPMHAGSYVRYIKDTGMFLYTKWYKITKLGILRQVICEILVCQSDMWYITLSFYLKKKRRVYSTPPWRVKYLYLFIMLCVRMSPWQWAHSVVTNIHLSRDSQTGGFDSFERLSMFCICGSIGQVEIYWWKYIDIQQI